MRFELSRSTWLQPLRGADVPGEVDHWDTSASAVAQASTM